MELDADVYDALEFSVLMLGEGGVGSGMMFLDMETTIPFCIYGHMASILPKTISWIDEKEK